MLYPPGDADAGAATPPALGCSPPAWANVLSVGPSPSAAAASAAVCFRTSRREEDDITDPRAERAR